MGFCVFVLFFGLVAEGFMFVAGGFVCLFVCLLLLLLLLFLSISLLLIIIKRKLKGTA